MGLPPPVLPLRTSARDVGVGAGGGSRGAPEGPRLRGHRTACAHLMSVTRGCIGSEGTPRRRLDGRLEDVAEAVGGRLLSVTSATEAGSWRQGDSGWAQPGGGGGTSPLPMHPWRYPSPSRGHPPPPLHTHLFASVIGLLLQG